MMGGQERFPPLPPAKAMSLAPVQPPVYLTGGFHLPVPLVAVLWSSVRVEQDAVRKERAERLITRVFGKWHLW